MSGAEELPEPEQPAQAEQPAQPEQPELAGLAAELVPLLAGLSAPAVPSLDGAGALCLDVAREDWLPAATRLRGAGFDFLDWLSAVDEPGDAPPGVAVVLHVADSSAPGERRVLLRTRVPDDDLVVASLTGVWAGVAWHERETFEMFGVDFSAFDDGSGRPLRPLLLPEGFEGTPLRKSFVLAARAAKPWPGAKEPGESDSDSHGGSRAPARRKVSPPGVPDPATWGRPFSEASTGPSSEESGQ